MKETHAIVNQLKQLLRAQGTTYAVIGKHLELSEASVKRCFAQNNFTLDRLAQICELVGIGIAELALMVAEKPPSITQLSIEQETELAGNPKLLLVAFLTINYYETSQISEIFALSENEIVGYLLQLDRLGMLELLPGNRVRRMVARNFSWRPDGPVQAYFEQQIKRSFFDTPFDDPGAHMRFVGGLLSNENLLRLHQEIERLTARFDECVQADRELPLDAKSGVGAVFAIRPWELPAFGALRRQP